MSVVHKFMFDAAFPFMGGKFQDYFLSLGAWDLTAGDAQEGFLGSRFQNILGMDWRLVFSPFGWLLGPGRRNPFTDMVMGLGDDVSFTYGARIQATYGGPFSEIIRGTRIRKIGSAQPTILSSGPPGMAGPLDRVFGLDGRDDPEELNSLVAKNIAHGDKAAFIAASALSVCLTLITNILEIVAHAKFGEYDKAHGHATIVVEDGKEGQTVKSGDEVRLKPTSFNATSDITSGFKDIRETHRWLPRRLMALIYHIEMAGTLTAYMHNVADGIKRNIKKIGTIAAYVAVPAVALVVETYMERKLRRSVKTAAFWVKLILALIFMILVILMFCAVL